MWFVNFGKARCKNCYACVRVCPVNAIKVVNDQAQIIKERCIVCGRCSRICPQKHRVIKSEISVIQGFFLAHQKVVASIAPSFAAVFGENSNKVPTALRKLGFSNVEETVVAAKPIVDVYHEYANKDDDKNYITSFCASSNNLIQKHYPELVENLIPVVSPFICHTRMLKEKYGKDTKVVFISPCLAKKDEGYTEDSVDVVITFWELEKWIKKEKIELESLEDSTFDITCRDEKLFPIVGSATKPIENNSHKKKIIVVDGIDDTKKILNGIKEGRFKNTLFDISACRHGCLGGSGLSVNEKTYYERQSQLLEYANKFIEDEEAGLPKEDEELLKTIPIYNEYKSEQVPLKIPSDEELKKILKSIGKFARMDELNCGSCGYKTCREKAIAVYNGYADITMCLPYMRQKAENMANVIFDKTQSLIGIVDKDFNIVEFNPVAERFFDVEGSGSKGLPIDMYLDEKQFEMVKEYRGKVFRDKLTLPDKSTLIQSITWLEENQIFIWIADDITKDEKKEKKLQKMKMDSVNMAQEVINKQMMVAQEIASLLGETTAETKVILTGLKKLIVEEEGMK